MTVISIIEHFVDSKSWKLISITIPCSADQLAEATYKVIKF